MDLGEVMWTSTPAQLSHRLNEGCRFDVTDSAAEFDDAYVGRFMGRIDGDLGDSLNPVLDGIGEVGNDLNRLSQVVTAAFAFYHMLIHLASCDGIFPSEGDVEVAFVVAQIKVNFAAIVEDKTFAVLGGCHCARIDIHVGVDFDRGDFEPDRLQQEASGRGYTT